MTNVLPFTKSKIADPNQPQGPMFLLCPKCKHEDGAFATAVEFHENGDAFITALVCLACTNPLYLEDGDVM